MNDLISHFNVSYKLFESDGNGGKKPFDSTKGLYTADVIADTAEEAAEKVKKDFHMLTVEIVSISDKMTMTKEEYENG